jgi:hypothetical protein
MTTVLNKASLPMLKHAVVGVLLIAAGVGVAGGVAAQAPPAAPPAAAQGAPAAAPASVALNNNLTINPKRLTFDRLGRSSAVYIFNQGALPATYDIKLIDRVMLPDGQIVPADEAATKPELKPVLDAMKSAMEMVIATPRRASLGPNAGQTVRVRAGGSAELPPGEYRTHLTVTAVPPADTGVTADQAASSAPESLSFRVTSVVGLSIPVIVRVGPADFRAAIENMKVSTETITPDGGGPARSVGVLSMDLVRVGSSSLFGDVEIRGERERGRGDPLGLVRGVGVYPEIPRRNMRILLQRIPAKGEELEIIFRDDDTAPGKILSRVTLTVS